MTTKSSTEGNLHTHTASQTGITSPIAKRPNMGVFGRLRARFLGFDLFISYAHSDGLGYAMALGNLLRREDLASFRDARELPVGSHLRDTIRWALQKSRMLVLIDSPGARLSDWVKEEVDEFLPLGRPIVRVDACAGDDGWHHLIERVHAREEPDALYRSRPSATVVDQIVHAVDFARVNRVGRLLLAVAGVMLVSLAIGLFNQYLEARDQRVRAEGERTEAERLLDFLVGDLRDSLQTLGRTELLREPAERALAYFERAADQDFSPERWALYRRALNNLGNVAMDADDLDVAAKRFAQGLDIAVRMARELSTDPLAQARVADSEIFLGRVALAQNQLDLATERFQSARQRLEQSLSGSAGELYWERLLITCRTDLARINTLRGDAESARNLHQQNVDATQRLEARFPQEQQLVRDEVVALDWIGRTYAGEGRPGDALSWLDRARARARQVRTQDTFGLLREEAVVLSDLGRVLIALNRLDEAIEIHKEALQASDDLARHDPFNRRWRADLATSHDDLGNALSQANNLTAAAEQYEASLAIRRELRAADPNNPEWQSGYATSVHKLGKIAFARQQWRGAVDRFRESNATLQLLSNSDRGNADLIERIAVNDRMLAVSLGELGDNKGAHAACIESLGYMQDLVRRDPASDLWKRRATELQGLCNQLAAQE